MCYNVFCYYHFHLKKSCYFIFFTSDFHRLTGKGAWKVITPLALVFFFIPKSSGEKKGFESSAITCSHVNGLLARLNLNLEFASS